MKRRTFVLGLGTATAGGSALLGAGAYSRTESQRGVTIETVGDEDAYLRLEYNDEIEFDCEREAPLLWITNQLTSTITGLTFDVAGETDGVEVEGIDVPDTLEVGEKGEIVARLACEGADEERAVNFDIEIVGRDLEVTAHRTDEIAIRCGCPEERAWALRVEEDGSTDPARNRLNEIPGIRTNAWGWYVPYTIGSGGVEAEFWAGAGGNDLENGTRVGDVAIDDDGAVLTVETTLFEDVTFRRSHLYVDTDTDRLRDSNAAPGRFEYSSGDEEYDDGTYEIPLSDVADELPDGDELVVALHGDVSR